MERVDRKSLGAETGSRELQGSGLVSEGAVMPLCCSWTGSQKRHPGWRYRVWGFRELVGKAKGSGN